MREILYGRQPVRETLRAGRRQVFKLLMATGVKPTAVVAEVLSLAESINVPVQIVKRQELDKLGGEVNHQGLAAEVSGYPYADLPFALKTAQQEGEPPFFLLLDHVQDPHNLGALLRTAEAAGVTPAAVRVSAGAAEHVYVAKVANLVQAMRQLQAAGVWLAGLQAKPEAQLYTRADLTGSLGLVVGSEGQGLARLVQKTCDFLIRLPMHGQVQSLNASVAGAIVLYEARRQRAANGRGRMV
jgi:23S rRNA (guanosine2251-2'-O)-methyltransferase